MASRCMYKIQLVKEDGPYSLDLAIQMLLVLPWLSAATSAFFGEIFSKNILLQGLRKDVYFC